MQPSVTENGRAKTYDVHYDDGSVVAKPYTLSARLTKEVHKDRAKPLMTAALNEIENYIASTRSEILNNYTSSLTTEAQVHDANPFQTNRTGFDYTYALHYQNQDAVVADKLTGFIHEKLVDVYAAM